jgi:hypothetical protein
MNHGESAQVRHERDRVVRLTGFGNQDSRLTALTVTGLNSQPVSRRSSTARFKSRMLWASPRDCRPGPLVGFGSHSRHRSRAQRHSVACYQRRDKLLIIMNICAGCAGI